MKSAATLSAVGVLMVVAAGGCRGGAPRCTSDADCVGMSKRTVCSVQYQLCVAVEEDAGAADGGDAGSTVDGGRVYAGRWVTAPNVPEVHNRYEHTATLLRTGDVLVVGGGNDDNYEPQDALFLADGGQWHSMSRDGGGRRQHTATLLQDGRVLIAGGDRGHAPSATVEIYSPASGTFEEAAPMSTPRSLHTATLLTSGEVLVAGGEPSPENGPTLRAPAEIFDPVSGNWRSVGQMSVSRKRHTATLFSSGSVMVTGGFEGTDGKTTRTLSTVEVFDPTSETWLAASPIKEARGWHQAVLTSADELIVIGGTPHDGWAVPAKGLATVESYSFETNTWSSAAPMVRPRWGATVSTLADGTLLAVGGQTSEALEDAETSSSSEVLSARRLWVRASSPKNGRVGHTATVLSDGRVLIVGGAARSLGPTTELYE